MNNYTVRINQLQQAFPFPAKTFSLAPANYNVWLETLLDKLGDYPHTFIPEFLDSGNIPNGSNLSDTKMSELEQTTILAAKAFIRQTVSPGIIRREFTTLKCLVEMHLCTFVPPMAPYLLPILKLLGIS